MGKQIIPVVFSTDDNYVLPLCVAIKSVIDNISIKDNIEIYVLHNGLTANNVAILNSFTNLNCLIKLVNVENFIIRGGIYSTGRFPISACFRFYIPEILKDHDKAIYLDCDILANRNIKELYKIDLEKNLVGANNFVAFFKEDFKFYFNSGVLLINNKLMREENITEQCLKYMAGHSDLCNPDEQTLNEICKNRVKYIPYIYNYQPWYCESEDALQKTGANKLSDIYIIHYGKKPWNNPHSPLADKWWKTAKSLPKDIYEQIKEKYNFSGKCKPQGYYKYYFANPINKFFIKLKRKIFKYRGKNE